MADDDTDSDGVPEGTELTEQRFAANLRVMREAAGLSQVALAQEMESLGWPWHQQTVTRIESGRRLVRLGEAKSVADILETSLDQLTEPTVAMQRTELLAASVRRARTAWRQIRDATVELLRARSGLLPEPPITDTPTPRLSVVLDEAREAAALFPDGAVTAGYEIVSREREFLADRQGMPGTVELDPATYEEAAQMVVDALRNGEVVELHLGHLPPGDYRRMGEFAAGAVRTRGGKISPLGPAGYVLRPAHDGDKESPR